MTAVSAETGAARQRFDAALAAFHEASRRAGGVVEQGFLVGNRAVRVRFAGDAPVPILMAAFAHLPAAEADASALTIHVWDSASTGVPLPSEDAELEEMSRLAMPASRPSDGIYAAYLRPEPGLCMLDLPASSGVYWLRDARRAQFEVRAQPFRAILNWWMVDHGLQFVHGACVGTEAGGVLIAARGGSGKSTTALASIVDGLLYVGDDYCLAEPRDGAPYVHSLYSTAKLHAHNLDRVPALRPLLANPQSVAFEKGIFYLHEHFPRQVVSGLPLRAIVVPRVSGLAETRIVPTSAAAALTSLAPSTLLQLASARAESFSAMAALVRSAPCFSLELGSYIPGVTAAIRDLLERLASGESDG